jgi:diguanylate cyclase (GGDEF)-like protein
VRTLQTTETAWEVSLKTSVEMYTIWEMTRVLHALQIGERVRRAIEVHRFQWIDTPIVGSTISVGAAQYRRGMSSDGFFQSADRAMYRAKQEGKNRVAQA